MLLEMACQMALVGKACFEGYLSNRHAFTQQLFGWLIRT